MSRNNIVEVNCDRCPRKMRPQKVADIPGSDKVRKVDLYINFSREVTEYEDLCPVCIRQIKSLMKQIISTPDKKGKSNGKNPGNKKKSP